MFDKEFKLLVLRETFEHMGSFSGYDLLTRYVEQLGLNPKYVFLKKSFFDSPATLLLKALRKLKLVQSPWYKGLNLYAEIRLIRQSRNTEALIHILYGENNLGLLSNHSLKGKRKLVVTVHQPSGWWDKNIQQLGKMFDSVDALIVLSGQEKRIFSNLTTAPVHFIPHGVDTTFFKPAEPALQQRKLSRSIARCVFVGQWLRDFRTLFDVVSLIVAKQLPAHFDFVVPIHPGMSASTLELIKQIESFSCVTSHQNLSDVELRALYQNANFLVLPLEESTANNSILEALACGIPVITTQTSGIGDYVDHSCARVCKPGDARDVTLQIGSLFENTVLQSSMSVAAREKAVSQFSWEKVSNEVAGLYRNVIYASRGNS